jgi:hypothetical protein
MSNHASKKEQNEKLRQPLLNDTNPSNVLREKLIAHCHDPQLKYLYIHN